MHTLYPNSPQPQLPPLLVDDLAENRQPDTELLALFLETGNRSALEPIVVRYSGLVYSVVSKVVYQSQDREDACQATFMSLVRSASRNQQSLASWLCSAAFRIAIRLRQSHRTRPGSLSLADLEMLAEQSPDPLSQVAQDIEREKLNVELQKLPTELRAPLVEHYFLGLSAPAIAERMELSVSAVEGRLRRGKQRLRSALARMGIGLSVVAGAVASMEKTATAASGCPWSSARDILELTLTESRTAGYVIRSNRIEIVPIIDANAVRMYDVSSIVATESENDQHQNLLKLVSDFVLRDKDLIQGGSAKISIAGNTLIVWCDEPTHREIEEFLGQVSKLEGGVGILTNHPEPPQTGGMGGMM